MLFRIPMDNIKIDKIFDNIQYQYKEISGHESFLMLEFVYYC